MPNDNEEVVEAEEVEGTEAEAEETKTEADTKTEEVKTEKSVESPEDRATRLLRQTNQARKKLGLEALGETKPETKSSKKSGDLDYGAKAFMVSALGLKGGAEMNLAKDFMANTGKSLDDLQDNKYFQAELKDLRELNATANAAPKGARSGNVATDSVEYWMGKPIEEVPQEMRIKVVNARLKKEENKGQFYNSK